jgi:hypothetical protein
LPSARVSAVSTVTFFQKTFIASVPLPASFGHKDSVEPLGEWLVEFAGVLLENFKLGVRIQRFNDVECQEPKVGLQ